MILIEDLDELLTDLALEELKMKSNKNSNEVYLFDLTSNIYLTIYVKFKRNLEPESTIQLKIKKSHVL